MSQLVEFPDVVGFYKTYLADALAANGYPLAHVSDVYNAGPGERVWLQRDGGPRLDVRREQARLRVNCLSDRHIEAFSQRVRAIVNASLGSGPIRSVRELSGPTEVPNVVPWRYMLFELVVIGEPVIPA